MRPVQITVGVGAGAKYLGVDHVIDLGPLHPSAHGAYRLRLVVADDVVTEAEPIVGYMHRGAEKLFEVRDYRQILVLANRHDWLSAFCNELGVVLAVERMTGHGGAAPRGPAAHDPLAELNRVLNHLMFLGRYPAAHRRADLRLHGRRAGREAVQAVMEEASGGRMHFMFNRVGGLKEDLPAGWVSATSGRCFPRCLRCWFRFVTLTVDNEVFRARHTGLGVLARESALALGVTGPTGRASGVDIDLRRDGEHLAYQEFQPVLGAGGDAFARVDCVVGEIELSLRLIAANLDDLPSGPVNLRLPKAVKAPEGSIYVWTEAPLGIYGVHLASRGEKTPWRLKLRTPSFNNVQALSALLPGTRVADLPAVLGSFAVVVGDIDK